MNIETGSLIFFDRFRFLCFFYFASLQARGAHTYFLFFTVYECSDPLNVRFPSTTCHSMRVTDLVSKSRLLSANRTNSHDTQSSLFSKCPDKYNTTMVPFQSHIRKYVHIRKYDLSAFSSHTLCYNWVGSEEKDEHLKRRKRGRRNVV